MTTRFIDYSAVYHTGRVGRWDRYPSFSGAVLDSRKVSPGMLFIARKGAHTDGNLFINDAVSRGAAFVIAENISFTEKELSVPVLVTDDPVKTLLDLVSSLRGLIAHQRIVAVTGSFGKTTTKDYIHGALSPLYKTGKTEGNLNTEWGVPLTYLNNMDREVLVMEMGMDRFGDIGILAEAVKPDIGVITNIAPVHMEFMKTIDFVYRGKTELFKKMDEKSFKLICGDDPVLSRARAEFSHIFSYGETKGNDYRISRIEPGKGQVAFCVNEEPYTVPAWSVHFAQNAAAAVAVALNMGALPREIKEGLSRCMLSPGRLSVTETPERVLIDDTYNSSPAALKAVISETGERYGSLNKLFCLGDMLELGEESGRYHKEALDLCSGLPRAHALLLGPEFSRWKEEFPQFEFFIGRKDYSDRLNAVKEDYRVIVVKGSRGLKMEEFLEELKGE